MGELIAGQWHRTPLIKKTAQGRFVRAPSGFHGEVRADGAPGPDGRTFAPEAQRYRLIVAWACPWAHRPLLARALLGLEDAIAVDVVEPLMGEDGWQFAPAEQLPTPGSTRPPVDGITHLHALYTRADAQFSGRVTVPVLWDAREQTIVSNDSAGIMRMLSQQFGALHTREASLLPADVSLATLDACNAEVHRRVNQAVYRCGFATTQQAYDEAVDQLFAHLDDYERRLGERRFLLAPLPCEADWRMLTTLVRFDWIYVTHFKCNLRRLTDYPNLYGYTRDLYQWPHVAPTVHEVQTKAHYFTSHKQLNPSGIVPRGFAVDLHAPAGRNHLP